MERRVDRIELSGTRLLVRVGRDFLAHRGLVRAASLSYTSLLALVPLAALVLSVTTSMLRGQDLSSASAALDRFFAYAVPQLQYLSADEALSARQEVLGRLQEAIARVHAGALGIFGVLTLVLVSISLLSAIEAALNDVWGVERPRTIKQRVVYYWAGLTLGPLLLFFALSLTSSGIVSRLLGSLSGGAAAAAFRFAVPFAILCTGATLLYWTMPNTRVPLRAALTGGITAGIVLQLNDLGSALYFSQVVGYGRVYGALGAVPVLMVGLYLSWAIVLLGAEVAHACAVPERGSAAPPVDGAVRSRIALEAAVACARGFAEGRGGADSAEIGDALGLPPEWIDPALALLCRKGFLIAAGSGAPPRYLPARPPRDLRALDVLAAARGDEEADRLLHRGSPAVAAFLERARAAGAAGAGEVTLEDLAGAPRPPA